MGQTTFPLLAADLLRLRASTIGVLTAASGAVAVVTMAAVSARVPTRQVRHALVVALVVLAGAFPLIGDAHGLFALTIGVLVLGLAGGLVFPALVTAVGGIGGEEVVRGSRDRPIALLGVSLSLGLAIGPFVETAVLALSHANLRTAFRWFALGPLAAALVMAVVIVLGADGSVPVAPPVPPVRVSLRRALADRAFEVALLGQLLYTAPFAAVVVFGALFARHVYGLSLSQVQIAFGVFFVMSFLVRSIVAWRSPIRHKLAWFHLSAVLTLAGLVVLAAGRDMAELLVAMALLGVPHGLTFPLSMGIVAEGRPHSELASVNARLSAAVQVVNLVLAPVLGLGIDDLGYRVTFALLVLPVAGAAVAQRRVAQRRAGRHQDGEHEAQGSWVAPPVVQGAARRGPAESI